MDQAITLYDFEGSPCARRVRIVLLEKGLRWTTRSVDLTKMEQKHPDYLKLNPNGVVPTLMHGDRVIYESNVITEYLDDVFPTPPLYPADPWERAQAKMWQAFELAMAKEYRPLMYLRVIGPIDRMRPKNEVMAEVQRSTNDAAHIDWVSRVYDGTAVSEHEAALLATQLYQRLDHLEQALQEGDFLVGDRFTIADLSVFPRVAMYSIVQLPIEPDRYPKVCGWLERVGGRPSLVHSAGVRPNLP
ncbi:MAG TPA: glutathione S-transferase family protein [Candidatus Acidoferrales bacterium]|nr:glutathione S-transferase family protein [Candidatus Acidoferrales bacterium]